MPVRAFGTFTQDLHDLADWFMACGVTATESTGIYWISPTKSWSSVEMIPDPGFINLDNLAIAFNPSSSLIASTLSQFRGSWQS
jgi:hypothetical protein